MKAVDLTGKKVIYMTPIKNPRTFGKTIGLYMGVALLTGCAALDTHQAKLDQKQLRDVLMDYIEDQILDNLIRARNGLPIVHYDLSHITATVSSKFTPTAGGSRMVTDVRTKTPTNTTVTTDQATTAPAAGQTIMNTVTKTLSVVGGVVETIAKPFTWGISAERNNAIGVEGAPVLDKPEVYAAYIKFLNTDIRRERSEKAGEKVTKVTTVTTEPTTVTTTTKKIFEPMPTSSPAITTETKQSEETTTTTTEEAPNATKPARITKETLDFKHTQSLARSPTCPTTAVLIGPKRWRDGLYYWVPIGYEPEFLELCLATVARGGAPSTAGAKSEEVKALEEFNSLERQKLLTPP